MAVAGKLGAGLGVLALGLTIALFFRRPPEPIVIEPSASSTGLQLREEPRTIDLGPPQTGVAPSLAEQEEPPTVAQRFATPPHPSEVPPPELPRQYREEMRSVSLPSARDSQLLDDTFGDSVRDIAPPNPKVRQRTHRVVDGDTLSRLALRYLGDADRFVEFYEANREVLPEPDMLPIGVLLKVPPKERPITAQPTPAAPQVTAQPVSMPVAPAPSLAPAPLVPIAPGFRLSEP